MDSMTAFMMGEANRGKTLKVFDWDKAFNILKEQGIKNAVAGLQGDLEWTGGVIIKDGKLITDDDTFLASTWATPVIVTEDGEEIECWCWDNPEDNPHKYDSNSKWQDRHLAEWEKLNTEK